MVLPPEALLPSAQQTASSLLATGRRWGSMDVSKADALMADEPTADVLPMVLMAEVLPMVDVPPVNVPTRGEL